MSGLAVGSLPQHLDAHITGDGVLCMPPLDSGCGGNVSVYASPGQADGWVWLKAIGPPDPERPVPYLHEVFACLTAEDARRLGEQLLRMSDYTE